MLPSRQSFRRLRLWLLALRSAYPVKKQKTKAYKYIFPSPDPDTFNSGSTKLVQIQNYLRALMVFNFKQGLGSSCKFSRVTYMMNMLNKEQIVKKKTKPGLLLNNS